MFPRSRLHLTHHIHPWAAYALLFLLLFSCARVSAQVYQWTDEKGRTHYGDKQQAPQNADAISVKPPNTADKLVPVVAPDDLGSDQKNTSSPQPSTPPVSRTSLSPTIACFEPSDRMKREGEHYFNIAPIALSAEQERALTALNQALTGKWRGHSHETACQGSPQEPTTTRQQSSVNATIDVTEKNALKVRLVREANHKYNWRGDVLYVFGRDTLLSLELRQPIYLASEKYRESSRTGSSLKETQTELQFSEHKLTLDTIYYVNGIFVGRETLRLRR